MGTTTSLSRLDQLGGIDHQYLSHQDEITPTLATFGDRFGTVLHASRLEVDLVEAVRPVDASFDARHVDDKGVEVFPTPGHAPGSACFVVDGAGGRYLTRSYPPAARRDMSDREQLLESLDVLATLQLDWVISSAFLACGRGAHRLDRPWVECVAEAAAALRERARV